MQLIKLRSFAFDALFALWTASFALGVPFFWIAGSPQRPIRSATRLWVRGTLFVLRQVVGLNHVVRGRENVPSEPCIIISNHQSTWETLAFLVLFPGVAIVAKQELLRVPIVSWYLKRSPMIIIDRDTGASALKLMLKQSRAALAEGRCVLLFPEGKRKFRSEPIRFRRGVELLYAQLGAPVLPVALNSGRFWPAGQLCKRPGTITVSFLPPIMPGLAPAEFTKRAEMLLEAERWRIDPTAFAE